MLEVITEREGLLMCKIKKSAAGFVGSSLTAYYFGVRMKTEIAQPGTRSLRGQVVLYRNAIKRCVQSRPRNQEICRVYLPLTYKIKLNQLDS